LAISLPVILVSQIYRVLHGGGPGSEVHLIVLNAVKLLVCAAVAIYLGPKVIRKPKPIRAAYDAKVITEGLAQTASGRRQLRLVKGTLVAMFIGMPLLVFGVVFGLMHWSKPALRHNELDWWQLGLPCFLVATNLVLYVMASGVVLKPNHWKWFLILAMVLVPVLLAPLVPEPVVPASLSTVFNPVLPVMLCLGGVWFLSGALTLVVFMSRNPVAGAEAT